MIPSAGATRRVNPDEIKDLPVVMTMVGGEMKYIGT